MVIQTEHSKQLIAAEVSFKKEALALGVIGCLYFLAHEVSFLFPDTQRILMAVWPAGGIGLGALLLYRKRLWPAIVATLFITGNVADLLAGRPASGGLGFMTGNVLESLCSAWVITRICGKGPLRFTSVKEIVALVLCAVGVNSLTACVGAFTALLLSPSISFWIFWRDWWISDGLGILLVTPFVITWVDFRAIIARARRARLLEIAVLSGLWIFTVWYAFCPVGTKILFIPQPYPYLIVALLAWAALRFEQAVVTTLLLAFAILAITSAGIRNGPYWWGGADAAVRLWSAQIFIGVITLVGLLHAASWSETRRARKHAEEERVRLVSLADKIPNAAIYQLVRNHDGTIHITYLSSGLEELTGIPAAAAIEDSSRFYGLVPEKDRESLAALHHASQETMTTVQGVIPLRHTNGAIRWVNLSSTPRTLPDGRVAWDGLMMDVTESKDLIRSLAASEAKYRTIVENITDQLIIHDFDGQILDVNESAAAMLGYSRDELVGAQLEKIMPPRHASLLPERLRWMLDRDIIEFESARLRKDGSIFLCEVHCKVVSREGKGVIQSFWRDISVRKKVEKTLRESEDKFFKLFHMSPFGLILTDAPDLEEGAIADINTEFLRIIERSRAEVIGRTLDELDVWDDEEVRRSFYHEFRINGRARNAECPYRSKSGRKGILLVSFDKVIINDEPCRIGSIMDITELRRMQEIAAKNDRLESIGVLAGGIAHDFNNLLGGMYGYIEMAQMQLEGSGNEKPLVYLDKALGIFERTRDLTRQLLTFAKGGSPVKKAGSLEAVVRGNAEFMLTGTPVTCTFTIPEPSWTCEFDENMIGQVIDNMVINAKQAMPEGGTIAIDLLNVRLGTEEIPLLKKGSYVRISIRDSGHGIPPDVLPKIFDPFFTTKTTGSGLGLATCYSVIKKHKGLITVESAEGAGTTFHIFLPAAPVNAEAVVSDAPAPGNTELGVLRIGISRVLIMDDEEYMREVVGTMLASFACSYAGVGNGNDALKMLQEAKDRQQPFDAVIMDLTIPGGMGGRETIGKLRIIDKTILAIAMSGYSEDPVMADPLRYGFDGCLAKPLRKADLERELRKGRA